jgi:16S rRNA (guanine966-N2)-methyltransferase
MGTLRVVGGAHRGRRLETPSGRSTRPTADKVREALFSILGPVDGLAVLDLYAGSGALGIEALSRGAAGAVLVDNDPAATAAIRANLAAIGAGEHARVVERDVIAWLRGAREDAAFDLVFADPPYDLAAQLGVSLTGDLPAVLADGALIVTESDKRNPLTLDLPLADERVYGDTRIAIHHGPE